MATWPPRTRLDHQRHGEADPLPLVLWRYGFCANVLALENSVSSGACNMAIGIETNVNRLYRFLSEISGKDLSP
jgi:hypothetical protein